MSLPIRTTVEDIKTVCSYLEKKPIGASIKEAKAVIDSKFLDGRKLSALKYWDLIEDQEQLKLTDKGRKAIRENLKNFMQVLRDIIRTIPPYNSIVERAKLNDLKSITATEVAAIWHEHFRSEVSDNEKIINDQSVCFFQIAAGAGLGNITIGRKGSPTRIDFFESELVAFTDTSSSASNQISNDKDRRQEGKGEITEEISDKRKTGGEYIFIGHGKNKTPLEQLKGILNQFKIPYKVAVEEPNLGRPIGSKVRETMELCNCAILIFTADEEFRDLNGNTIWRPSENVVYELGASGFLYDKRIVILKEDTVEFPSNFKDLGYISFSRDQLSSKSVEVLKELIGFGIVKITV